LPHCTIDGTIYWNYRKEWEALNPLLFFTLYLQNILIITGSI
jgi:hypothetical protein